MKILARIVLGLIAAAAGTAGRADFSDALDRVDEALSVSARDDFLRAHLSGLFDAEWYEFQQPPPGLIVANADTLFQPRLSLFLDAQAGAHLYAFAQVRADRGFDPANGPFRGRFDEYALRLMTGAAGGLSVQVGKFATVVGNWAPRHNSWSEPFITAPLAYENLTGIWDAFPVRSGSTLLAWSHLRPFPPFERDANKTLRLPILWGPNYATGAAASAAAGALSAAVEIKNAALSSRPYLWDAGARGWNNPTISGRIGYRPSPEWSLGASASEGSYLDAEAEPFLPANVSLSQYRQIVLGQDAAYARHHFQVWAEVYESRFAIPTLGAADTLSYYLEAKQTFAPQWFAALRWNQQVYGSIPVGPPGGPRSWLPWGRDVWRTDLALGHRFNPRVQAKVQYSLQQGGDVPAPKLGHTTALQLTLRL